MTRLCRVGKFQLSKMDNTTRSGRNPFVDLFINFNTESHRCPTKFNSEAYWNFLRFCRHIRKNLVSDQLTDASVVAECCRELVGDTDDAESTANTASMQDTMLSSPSGMQRCKLEVCTQGVWQLISRYCETLCIDLSSSVIRACLWTL